MLGRGAGGTNQREVSRMAQEILSCYKCGKPSPVLISTFNGKQSVALCLECYEKEKGGK